MTKAEEKRAAIIAQQAARQLADAATQQSSGTAPSAGRAGRGRRRFMPTPTFGGRPQGRPPKT